MDSKADIIGQAFKNRNPKELHLFVKDVLVMAASRKHVSSIKVLTEDGILAQSLVVEELVFRDHFCNTLHGTVQSCSALISESSYPDACRYDGIESSSLAANSQTPVECLKLFKSLVKGKGWGESRIDTDTWMCFRDALLPIWYPIVVTTFCLFPA